jgi:hypothetical protein
MKENDVIVILPEETKGRKRRRLISRINKKAEKEGFYPFVIERYIFWISGEIKTLVFHKTGRASYCCRECKDCDVLCINRGLRHISSESFIALK